MASPIEEVFVKSHLKGRTVLEFGCSPGKFATEMSKMGYKVVGVDLYEAEFKESYTFKRGDIVDLLEDGSITGTPDNVVAVSSIEHCGIETANFGEEDRRDLSYHYSVASKLIRLVAPEGQLIATVPFGDGGVYYVDKDGNNGTGEEIKKPAWGYRTFNKESIMNLFPTMELVKCKAYKKLDGLDYFDMLSWEEIPLDAFNMYNNKHRAVMCCIFKQRDKVFRSFGDGISWEKHVDENIVEGECGREIFYSGDSYKKSFENAKDYIKTDTPIKERKALDCGCHMGRFIDSVRAYGFTYTGVDQCGKALKYASNHRPDGEWVHTFLWDMGYSEVFDMAFTNAVLQHNLLKEQEKIVPAIYKALKPGGVFMMTEGTGIDPVEYPRSQRTQDGWIRMVEGCGFKLIKTSHPNHLGVNDKYFFTKERCESNER